MCDIFESDKESEDVVEVVVEDERRMLIQSYLREKMASMKKKHGD